MRAVTYRGDGRREKKNSTDLLRWLLVLGGIIEPDLESSQLLGKKRAMSKLNGGRTLLTALLLLLLLLLCFLLLLLLLPLLERKLMLHLLLLLSCTVV